MAWTAKSHFFDESSYKYGLYWLYFITFSWANTMLGAKGGYNEQVYRFIPTGNMNEARHNHTATRLLNGKVLITGGVQYGKNCHFKPRFKSGRII